MRDCAMESIIAVSMLSLAMRVPKTAHRLQPSQPIEPDENDLKRLQKAQEKRDRREAKLVANAKKGMKA